ncbi:hypothetical protein BKA57DRAFT_441960 [Linnemannia elongata]|nr:hypothetical protein BKA57DRAFT_441960 [Linnemannia elongata]
MDDLLSQLPLECIQKILEIITNRARREALTSLNALLHTNRYIAKVTLPFVYHNPFLDEYRCNFYSKQGPRKLIRNLLGDVLLCGGEVPKNLIDEFQLDSSHYINTDVKGIHPITKPLNYLGYLRYLNIPMLRFKDSILRGEYQLSKDEVGYVEGDEFWSQCPVSNDSMVLDTTNNNNMDSDELEERLDQRKKELAWYFWRMGLYRDTLWALATPVLDHLEGLSFPLSDISRWIGVVGRLGRLETLEFILDEIPSNIFFINPVIYDEGSKLYKDEAMQALVHFVSEHTRLFKGRLKTVNTSPEQYRSRHFNEYWHHAFQPQIYRLLPPMNRPTFLTEEGWTRLLAHPETTDLGYVREVEDWFGEWGRVSRDEGLEKYPRFLQRCRVLRRMTLRSFGRGGFRWAVEEKEKYLLGEEGERGRMVSGLVPLERVEIYAYDASTDEADDIAFAFSDTLRDLFICYDIQNPSLPRTIEIGRGWVNMMVLTVLRIEACYHRLLIDQMLLSHCPNLAAVHLADGTQMYQCQDKDIIPTLPGELEKVIKLELEGWPALTFHPATLSSASELKVLRICVGYREVERSRFYFIPPVEELSRSYGEHQDADELVTGIGVGQEGGETLPLIIQRPVWSWDWKFRQLRKLEFTGEFAFRFQFRMLCGCPVLEELVLEMETEQEDSHVRVLTHDDFSIPDDDTVLDEFDVMDPTSVPAQEPMKRFITAHSVTAITMSGAWVLSEALFPTLLYDSFPNLGKISLLGCNGFTLPELITYLRTTQRKQFIRVVVSFPEPTQDEKKELGILRRNDWMEEVEALKFRANAAILKVRVCFWPSCRRREILYVVLKDVEYARE